MAARRFDPAALRTVHVIADNDAFKALYFDRERNALRANLVFVDPNGSVLFETNAAGLKGDPLDPARKLAVVWGDSVVFGAQRSWPCLLDGLAPGWQFLNGGLEGDPYANILRRAEEFNRRHPVALNVLMLGWHPFLPLGPGAGSSGLRAVHRELDRMLTAFLDAVPNTAVATMPTSLNPQILDLDLSTFFVEGDDDRGFVFLRNLPYRVGDQRHGFEHIIERNAIAREVCARRKVRLIDLFAAFDTAGLADFREHFYDAVHFRPRSYPAVARIVREGIGDLLD